MMNDEKFLKEREKECETYVEHLIILESSDPCKPEYMEGYKNGLNDTYILDQNILWLAGFYHQFRHLLEDPEMQKSLDTYTFFEPDKV